LLITPKAPTANLEGYVVAGVGDYSSRKLEGALNVPLGDWAATRFAGALQRRDGYTKNVTIGQLLDDELERVKVLILSTSGRSVVGT